MAGCMNKVILVGNLGKDPEVRHSNAGQKIVNLTLATTESWKDKSGQKQDKTEWHRIVIFNPGLADIAERYLKKGSKAYIEGSLQTRKWTDQNGQEKYTTEIVLGNYRGEILLLDSRGGGASAESGSFGGGDKGSSGWDSTPESQGGFDPDDQIPF